LLAFAGARLVSGADWVLDTVSFDSLAANADWVITGEGRLDRQTRSGKLVARVAERARRAGARCVALVGELALSPDEVKELGLDGAFAIAEGAIARSEAKARAAELLRALAESVIRSRAR
jgi:glycerate kinase